MTVTIRRRAERSEFVQVPNATANDSENLSLEALGLLVHLLHRPDDWRISCEQIRSQWSVGRDKLTGLLGELRRAGYAELVDIKGEGGKITGREYVISSRADLCDRARLNPDPEKPGQGADPDPEFPCQGKPVDIQRTESTTKTDIPLNPPSDALGEQFERFMSAYGFDVTMPIAPARKMFASLLSDERELAIEHAPTYRSECERQKRQRAKPHTWLRQRGWEIATKLHRAGSLSNSNPSEDTIWIARDSAEWEAADADHFRRTGRRLPVDSRGGWRVPAKRSRMVLPPPRSGFIERSCNG